MLRGAGSRTETVPFDFPPHAAGVPGFLDQHYRDRRTGLTRLPHTHSLLAGPRGGLLDGVELDPVHEGVVVDGPGVGGSLAESFEIRFPGAADIVLVDRAERNQFDGVDLDPARSDPATAPRQHLPPAPEPERDSDLA